VAQRVLADAGALDERGEHRVPRQRRAPEHAAVQHRRVGAVAARLLAAQVLGQSDHRAEVVDRLRDAGGVDRQRRPQGRRDLVEQRGVLGVRPGQDRLDLQAVRHALHGTRLRHCRDAAAGGRLDLGQLDRR
jgi:hypothetical protein